MKHHQRNGRWRHSWDPIIPTAYEMKPGYEGLPLSTGRRLYECWHCDLAGVTYSQIEKGGLGECRGVEACTKLC